MIKNKLLILFTILSVLALSACGGSSGGGGVASGGGGPISDSSDIALFANGTYVDYIPGNSNSEASNAEAMLRAQGHTVTPFTGITATDITQAVAGKSVLVIQDLEIASLNPDLDAAARSAIANFVNGGGTLIAGNDSTGNLVTLLNAIFGFTLTDNTQYSLGETMNRNAADAVGTPYENCGPSSLPANDGTYTIATASLPAGAKTLYTGPGAGEAALILIPQGSGNLVITAYDFWNAKPVGTQDGGWWSVIYRASRLNKTLPDVGVVAAPGTASRLADVVAKLDGTCQFNSVTGIDASSTTPTLAAMQAFDSILVFSNVSFADNVALGDNLADYVDAGGGLVMSVFAFNITPPDGRFLTDNYYGIPAASSQTSGIQETGLFNFTGHALLAGVTSFDGGSSSFQPNTSAVVTGVGATRIADWSDGTTPLVVTRAIGNARRADLGFYPPSSDDSAALWDATTDGDKLMANALTWTADRSEPSSTTSNSADTPVDLPDQVVDATSTITVSGGPTSISKVTVTLNITHAYDDDLDIFLESPTGTMVELVTDIGGGGNDFTNTVLDDAAATAASAADSFAFAPFTGSFIPEGSLAGLIGEDANGGWILRITDDAIGDSGTLDSWSISIR